MTNKILSVENLSKSFTQRHGKKDKEILILKNLSFGIDEGIITALVGGNGSGKTTLFNIISRFTEVNSGEIHYKDIDLLRKKAYDCKDLGIGRMFQDNHIFQNLTILDNMMIADSDTLGENPIISLIKPKKINTLEQEREIKAKIIFEDLFGEDSEFWEKRNDKASALSYGQQRLLGLARLFMNDYKLVLLDEPTSGVDPVKVDKICEILVKMKNEKNMTIFLIEHNFKTIRKVADWAIFLSEGAVFTETTPEDLYGNENFRKKYLGI